MVGLQGLGAAAVLNVLWWLVLAASIPFRGFRPVYLVGAGAGGLLVGGLLVLVLSMSHDARWVRTAARLMARLAPASGRQRLTSFLAELSGDLRQVVAEPRMGARAATWAALQWVLDCASLWVLLDAFGLRVAPDSLFVAFGLANLIAFLPNTPGELGVFEATLTSALVGFSLPRASVVVAVLAYRLAEFWLPIPIGALGYLSFRRDERPVTQRT